MKESAIERQVREHGYSIMVKVERDGTTVVTLKDSYAGHIIMADSAGWDDEPGMTRYDAALTTAAKRMLDYVYRNEPDKQPKVGRYEYDGMADDWHEEQ